MPYRNAIVGGSGGLVIPQLQSPNYSWNGGNGPITGWKIKQDGDSVFGNSVFSGLAVGPVSASATSYADLMLYMKMVGQATYGPVVTTLPANKNTNGAANSYIDLLTIDVPESWNGTVAKYDYTGYLFVEFTVNIEIDTTTASLIPAGAFVARVNKTTGSFPGVLKGSYGADNGMSMRLIGTNHRARLTQTFTDFFCYYTNGRQSGTETYVVQIAQSSAGNPYRVILQYTNVVARVYPSMDNIIGGSPVHSN